MTSSRESFKSQRIGCDHVTQRINEQCLALATIEPESHFIEIGWEMFGADFVPRSDNASLEQAKGRFNSVCSDAFAIFIPSIFFSAMIDALVFSVNSSSLQCVLVSDPFVCNQYVNVLTDVFFDVLRECASPNVACMEEAEIATALPYANDNLFFGLSDSLSMSEFPTTDEGFVHLANTIKHGLIYLFHGGSDAMAQIPRGFIRAFVLSPDSPLELECAHAFLSLTEQQDSKKPLLKRQMGVVEDRASGDGELIITVFAIEDLLGCCQFNDWTFTTQTFNASRPAKPDKQFTALFIRIEQVYNVN